MIPIKDRLINDLQGCIYKSLDDPREMKINIENVFYILSDYGYVLPRKQYESVLEDELEKNLPQDLTVDALGRYRIALALLNLAERLHIPKSLILKYQASQKK